MISRALHQLEGSYQRGAVADDPGSFLDWGNAVLVFRHHSQGAEVELDLLCAWDTSQQLQNLGIPACCGDWMLQGKLSEVFGLQDAHVRRECKVLHSILNHFLGILNLHTVIIPTHVK